MAAIRKGPLLVMLRLPHGRVLAVITNLLLVLSFLASRQEGALKFPAAWMVWRRHALVIRSGRI
jgi:hypothetical protein